MTGTTAKEEGTTAPTSKRSRGTQRGTPNLQQNTLEETCVHMYLHTSSVTPTHLGIRVEAPKLHSGYALLSHPHHGITASASNAHHLPCAMQEGERESKRRNLKNTAVPIENVGTKFRT